MSGLDKLGSLDQFPIFSGLTTKQLNWVRERLYARILPAGADLITIGATGELMYIIIDGTVKVYAPQLDGDDVFIAILGPGDPVGEMSLVDHVDRSASVITLTQTTLVWMNKHDFEQGLETIPRLATNLLQIISRRLRRTNEQIQNLASLNVTGRVAATILSFAGQYGVGSNDGMTHIPIRLTQSDLADLVGASRKRVNYAIVELKRNDCISISPDYEITVLNEDRLAKWCR